MKETIYLFPKEDGGILAIQTNKATSRADSDGPLATVDIDVPFENIRSMELHLEDRLLKSVSVQKRS